MNTRDLAKAAFPAIWMAIAAPETLSCLHGLGTRPRALAGELSSFYGHSAPVTVTSSSVHEPAG